MKVGLCDLGRAFFKSRWHVWNWETTQRIASFATKPEALNFISDKKFTLAHASGITYRQCSKTVTEH